MFHSAGADVHTIANKCIKRNSFSLCSGGQKSTVKVWIGLIPQEALQDSWIFSSLIASPGLPSESQILLLSSHGLCLCLCVFFSVPKKYSFLWKP